MLGQPTLLWYWDLPERRLLRAERAGLQSKSC
jgi:hypothetical protein